MRRILFLSAVFTVALGGSAWAQSSAGGSSVSGSSSSSSSISTSGGASVGVAQGTIAEGGRVSGTNSSGPGGGAATGGGGGSSAATAAADALGPSALDGGVVDTTGAQLPVIGELVEVDTAPARSDGGLSPLLWVGLAVLLMGGGFALLRSRRSANPSLS